LTQAGIEDLRVKRDTIRTLLQVEEEEKIAIQRGLIMLNQRLVQIDDSLSRKYDYTIECDKRIHEIIEAATDSKVSGLYILITSLSSAPANLFLSQFSSPLCAASRTGLLSFSLYRVLRRSRVRAFLLTCSKGLRLG
jgi:Sjoegren syndrome nuclear autoantigen 1